MYFTKLFARKPQRRRLTTCSIGESLESRQMLSGVSALGSQLNDMIHPPVEVRGTDSAEEIRLTQTEQGHVVAQFTDLETGFQTVQVLSDPSTGINLGEITVLAAG
ncbi:MAG: hypothetical protein KDA80_24335, partial [Planctomycetaceae bacterium]|nr:hypothetical protein [Planctomycetaceae bacterium]